jgi:hypothetical protein
MSHINYRQKVTKLKYIPIFSVASVNFFHQNIDPDSNFYSDICSCDYYTESGLSKTIQDNCAIILFSAKLTKSSLYYCDRVEGITSLRDTTMDRWMDRCIV